MREIREELQHPIDKHSKRIIATNTELLLNHCIRFYDRQFVTREEINHDVLKRFEVLLNNYFDSPEVAKLGLSTVAWAWGSYFGGWQAAEVMLLGLAVYIVQVIVCKVWLKYFQYGPLEWLWRSLTYFNKQPFLKKNRP